MPSIVQLVSMRHWKKKIDRSRWLSVNHLQPKRTGLGWDGYDERFTVTKNITRLFGGLPDIVLAYKPADYEGFAELPCFTVMPHNEVKEGRFAPEIKQARPDLIVFHHMNNWQQQQERLKELGIESVHIPHVADPAIFHDYGQEKQWDVMTCGAMGGKIYPLRGLFRQACVLLRERGYRCLDFLHPGNELKDADKCHHLIHFAQACNQSRITCFCSSVFRYRLQKYVEVAACGSAMAADVPVTEDDLEDVLIECNADESAETITDRLAGVLDLGEDVEWARRGKQFARGFEPRQYGQRLLNAIETVREIQTVRARLRPRRRSRRCPIETVREIQTVRGRP